MGAIQITTGSVPISDGLQKACCIPLVSVLQPLLPAETSSQTSNAPGAADLDAKDISRCHGCLAYVNHLCSFERTGWACSLCGVLNEYSSAANVRYLGGPEARSSLPELKSGTVEGASPVQHGNQDEGTPDVYSTPATPIFVALVDTSSSPEFIDLVKSALSAALEGLPPGARFGLAGFGGDSLSLFEATPGGSCVRHVPITLHEAEPTALTLDEVLPLSNFLSTTSGDEGKQCVGAAIDALEPETGASSNNNNERRRPMGEALQALLRYLGSSALEGGQNVAGARLLVFLSGPPNIGKGSVVSIQKEDEEQGDAGMQGTPFIMDPYFPELTAWNIPQQAGSMNNGRERERDRESSEQSGWAKALEASVDLKPAAAELGLSSSTSHAVLRWGAQGFYAQAGAAAASLGVSIDVCAVSSTFIGLELMHSLTERSGGSATLYPISPREGEECALPQDVYKRLSEPRGFRCLLRVRTSPELRVTGALGHKLRADPRSEDLFHLPCCHAHDAFGMRLQHTSSSGFASRSTPVVQMVFQYLQIVPVRRQENEVKAEFSPSTAHKFELRRRIRIVTSSFPLASTAAQVYRSVDADAYAFALVHEVWRMAETEGVDTARAALVESIVRFSGAFHEWITVGEFLADAGARAREGGQHTIDPSFRAVESMQLIPRLVYALLRSPVLGTNGGGGGGGGGNINSHPDMLCALRMLWEVLPPAELSTAISPHLSSWHSPDALAFPRHTLSRAALALARQPVYLLDAYDTLVIYYSTSAKSQNLPFPPPRTSQLWQHVAALRQARRLTPRVVVVEEGKEGSDQPFTSRLIEDEDSSSYYFIQGESSAATGTYVDFLQQIAELVAELIENEGV